MSNVDGVAAFLGLDLRRDVTEDFRSASMRRNPSLQHSMPAKLLEQFEQSEEHIKLCAEIEGLSSQIKAATTQEEREELKLRQDRLYYRRRRLREEERDKYKRSQQRVYNTESAAQDGGDW